MFKTTRNTGTRGYTGYRGRTGGGRRWLILALALIILAGAVFLFAQRFRVYRSDGSSYIELPWSRRAPAPAAPAAPAGGAGEGPSAEGATPAEEAPAGGAESAPGKEG